MRPGLGVARLGVAAATLAAFGLRIWGIGDLGDLDFDEQASYFIGSMPPAEMLRYLLGAPFEHPPLFYLLFHAWLTLAGGSETAMRVFPVLPGTLTVPLLGVIAGRVGGARAAVVAAWLLALSPLHVYYSRDARMYSLLGLLTVVMLIGSTWQIATAGRVRLGGASSESRMPHDSSPGSRSSRWVRALPLAAAGAGVAALTTHYYALFVVLGMLVGLWWVGLLRLPPGSRDLRIVGRRWLIGGLVFGAALVLAGLAWLGAASGLRTSLTAVYPRGVEPGMLAQALLGAFAAPFASPLTPPGWLVPAAVLTVLVLISALRLREEPAGAMRTVVLVGFLVPTLAVPLLLLLGRPFAPRFVALATPLLPLLAGLAATRLSRRTVAIAAAAAASVVLLGLVPMYGGYTRGDYGRAMAALRAEARPDDAIVLNGPWQDLLFRRYGAGLPPRSIIASTVPLIPDEAERNLAAIAAVHPRVWIVDAATDAADPSGVVTSWMDRHAYPRPVIPFEKALLRPYLTDVGRSAAMQERSLDVTLLNTRLNSVALDTWQLAPGQEVRVRLTAQPACAGSAERCVDAAPGDASPGPGRRLVLRVAGAGDTSLWHWDGALTPIGERLEYRAALVVPPDTPSGRYPLQAIAYEVAMDESGGRQIARMTDPTDLGEVAVVRSP